MNEGFSRHKSFEHKSFDNLRPRFKNNASYFLRSSVKNAELLSSLEHSIKQNCINYSKFKHMKKMKGDEKVVFHKKNAGIV